MDRCKSRLGWFNVCKHREAYPEVIVSDIQFAYNITDLVNLDKKRSVIVLALSVLHCLDRGHSSS